MENQGQQTPEELDIAAISFRSPSGDLEVKLDLSERKVFLAGVETLEKLEPEEFDAVVRLVLTRGVRTKSKKIIPDSRADNLQRRLRSVFSEVNRKCDKKFNQFFDCLTERFSGGGYKFLGKDVITEPLEPSGMLSPKSFGEGSAVEEPPQASLPPETMSRCSGPVALSFRWLGVVVLMLAVGILFLIFIKQDWNFHKGPLQQKSEQARSLPSTTSSVRDFRQPNPSLLVADFDGPEQEFGMTNAVIECLRKELEPFGINVQPLRRVLTAADGPATARRLAEQQGALGVAWGAYRQSGGEARLWLHADWIQQKKYLDLTGSGQIDVPLDKPFLLEDVAESELTLAALLLTADLKIQQEDYQTARTILDSAQRRSSHNSHKLASESQIFILRGITESSQKDWTAASRDWRIAHDLTRSADIATALGVSYVALRDFSKARQSFQDALAEKPTLSEKATILGNLAGLELVHGSISQASRLISEANAIAGNDPFVMETSANIKMTTGDLRGAASIFQQIMEIPNSEAEGHAGIGDILDREGKESDAKLEFDRAVTISATNVRGLTGKARLLDRHGPSKELEQVTDQLLRAAPDDAFGLFLKGKILGVHQDFPAAIVELDKVVKIAPNNDMGYAMDAAMHIYLKQYPHALRLADIGLRKVPRSTYCTIAKGVALGRMGRLQLAQKTLEGVLRTDHDTFAEKELLRIYVLQHRWNAAMNIAQHFLIKDPAGAALAHAITGKHLMLTANAADALKEYDAAIPNLGINYLEDGFQWVYMDRAVLRRNLGDLKGAVADLESYLQLNPHDKTARRSLIEIRQELGAQYLFHLGAK